MSCSKIFRLLLLSVCAALYCGTVLADDTIVKEDFTGTTTTNSWYFFNGACLTASSTKSAASTSPGSPPGCVGDSYYSSNFPNEKLVGGFNGKSGSTLTLPDPDGNGAHGLNERMEVRSVYVGRDYMFDLVKAYADTP